MNTIEIIKNRRSVRAFDGTPLSVADSEKMKKYLPEAANPYGIPVEFGIFNSSDSGISSAVITGAATYIVGKIKKGAHAEEAYGYSFQKVLLFAGSLGIGNVWLAGTFSKKEAASAIGASDGFAVPAVSPLGYKASKMSLRETVMRKTVRSDSRRPFGELFFDENLSPLEKGSLGVLADAFEAVRLAPSAVNVQPWRIVFDGRRADFFKAARRMLNGFDVHLIDMGIALCHFDAVLTELEINHELEISEPKISPDGAEYVASYILE